MSELRDRVRGPLFSSWWPRRLRWPASAAIVALALALGASAAAGCTSDEEEPAFDYTMPDASTAVLDAGGTPEAAPPEDAGRTCATDIAGDGLARHLDCTGLYTSLASKALGPDVRPYTPAVQFWSDGAKKDRWVYLPPGSTIDATNLDDWKLPVGTKLWKEFAVDGKRIETRLFTKVTETSWRSTTYRWNATEDDAVRLDSGETIKRAGAPDYEVPRSDQCRMCHKGRTEPVLGFEPLSLGLDGAQGVTLATLAAEKRLVPAPASTTLAIPDDGTTKAAKALGWLHANCGSCHQKSDTAEAFFSGVFFQIRPSQLATVASASELDAVTTTCGIASTKTTPDGGLAMIRLDPGSPETSSLVVLPSSRAAPGVIPSANDQMPPIVSHAVDLEGVTALREWVAALTKCP